MKLFWLKVSKVPETPLDKPLLSTALMAKVTLGWLAGAVMGTLTAQFALLPVKVSGTEPH